MDLGPFAQVGLFYTEQTTFPTAVGDEYVVFGMALFNNGLTVLVSSQGHPVWLPIQLFVVEDSALPAYWEFSVAQSGSDDSELGVQARWGYHELVTGVDHYVGLIEGDAPALERFEVERGLSR